MYATLKMWLEMLGVSSGVEMCATPLIQQALHDATPQANTLKV